MLYRFTTTVSMESSGTFGYPIYQTITLNGSTVDSGHEIKAASPSYWSSYTYTTGWFTVSGKTSGSVPLTINTYSGLGSSRDQNNSYTLTVLPAASVITSFPSFYIGDAPVIYYTKYSSDFIDAVSLTMGGKEVLYWDRIYSGVTFMPTKDEIAAMYASCPNASSVSVNATITTKSGSSVIGTSSKSTTALVRPSPPRFTAFSYQDINEQTLALSGDNKTIVNGQSTLRITLTPGTAKNSATIAKYTAQAGTVIKEVGPNETTIVLDKADGGEIKVTCTDSRGFTTTVTKQAEFIDYSSVRIGEVSFKRDNDMDTKTKMTVKGTYITQSNEINSLTYRYKETSSSVWSNAFAITPDIGTNTFTFSGYINGDLGSEGFDAASSYDVQVTVTDKLTSMTKSAILPTGTPGIYMQKSGGKYAIGIGKKPEISYGVDIDGEVRLNHSPVVTQANMALMAAGAGIAKNIALSGSCLWEGQWSDGAITMKEAHMYTLFAVKTAGENPSIFLAMREEDKMSGISGVQRGEEGLISYIFKAAVKEEGLELIENRMEKYPYKADYAADFTISKIYALI